MNIIEAWKDSWPLYIITISDMRTKGITPVRPILRITCWIKWYKINR